MSNDYHKLSEQNGSVDLTLDLIGFDFLNKIEDVGQICFMALGQ